MTSKLAFASAIAVLAGVCLVPLVLAARPATAAASTFGVLHTFTPQRILDTRGGNGAPKAPVAANHAVRLQVTTRAGIPAGVSAAVLNVTATGPTSTGFVSVYPDDKVRTTASNLNFGRGQTVANAVIVPVGADGGIELFNSSGGTVQLVADVSGYYAPATGITAASQGAFAALPPVRILDTRGGLGAPKAAVPANHRIAVTLTGSAGVPDGVSAVVLNVTVTGPTSTGFITAYPDGTSRPSASNLNFVKGQTVPNLVVAPVGAGGRVDLFNSSGGTVQLVADVFGYYVAGTPTQVGALGAVQPARLLDTRSGIGQSPARPVGANQAITLQVNGRGGAPTGSGSPTMAVVLNVTVTSPTSTGFISVYPGGSARTTASSVNFTKGKTVPNLVVAPVGANGTITLFNSSGGTVQLVADMSAYVRATALDAAPTASTSHYVRNLTTSSDSNTLHAEGCTDATVNHTSGAHVVLLDVGAQVVFGASHGVELTGTSTTLLYSQLVTGLDGYLAGYGDCNTGFPAATIAIGTNNDGTFSTYSAAAMGADWANQVLDLVTIPAGKGITVVGADDIEAGFVSTEAEAETWITSYLANTSASLIYNGSADGCPTTVGAINQSCAFGWTQVQYYRMAHSLNPGRIALLPQIYVAEQATQWANIDLGGGGGIGFAGALTEHAACGSGCSFTPDQGWATLRYALSTNAVTVGAAVPASTDLQVN